LPVTAVTIPETASGKRSSLVGVIDGADFVLPTEIAPRQMIRNGAPEPFQLLKNSELDEIVAYKVDRFVVDVICLAFKSLGTDKLYVVTEDNPRWDQLLEVLQQRLGIVHTSWLRDVALPAFAPNVTTLWKRSG
jgi:hypothetical protein